MKIDKKSYKNIDFYYIGYITRKIFDYVNIYSVNTFCLNIDKGDGYIEESNGNKYLSLVSTDKNEEILTKYSVVLKKISDKPVGYEEKYMKIRFNSDNNAFE